MKRGWSAFLLRRTDDKRFCTNFFLNLGIKNSYNYNIQLDRSSLSILPLMKTSGLSGTGGQRNNG